MWPAKKGLGSQITYGLDGASLHLEQYDEDRPWKFSRESSSGITLKEVKESAQTIVPPQVPTFESEKAKADKYTEFFHSVPYKLMEDLQKADAQLDTDFIYDPSIGKLMDFGVVYNNEAPKNFVAFASSAAKSQLIVHYISEERAKLERIRNHNEEDNSKLKKKNQLNTKIPIFGDGVMLDVNTAIKQVEFAKSCVQEKLRHKFVYLRTTSWIYMVRIKPGKADVRDIDIMIAVPSSELKGEEFAHVISNPYDALEFAVIDLKGNWGVFRVTRDHLTVKCVYSGVVNDFGDFSKFKRISWGDRTDEIYIMSRHYLKKINLAESKSIDLLTLNKWSEVREFTKSNLDDDYSFLLTSRELILINTAKGFKRVLSWKHFLDNEDPTLRMALSAVDETQYVIIFSQFHGTILVYQFNLEDDLPKSIHDPLILHHDRSTSTKDLYFFPFDNHFALFKMSTDLEVTRSLFASSRLKQISGPMDPIGKAEGPEGNPALNFKKFFDKSLDSQRESLKLLATKLMKVPKKSLKHPDAHYFQEYAAKLVDIRGFKDSKPLTLMNYTTPIDTFSDFDEFDNMFWQLKQYLNQNEVSMMSFQALSKNISKYGKFNKFKDLNKVLSNLWKSPIVAKEATRDMALSLSVIYDPAKESTALNRKIAQLPTKLKDLIDGWDDDGKEEEYDSGLSKYDEFAMSQSQLPTIKITQSQPLTQTKRIRSSQNQRMSQSQKKSQENSQNSSQPTPSQEIPEATQDPFSSQLSSLKPSQLSRKDPLMSSQVLSSQLSQRKKKKRKIKGFA